MTNTNIREVHKLLDALFDNSELSHAQIDLIRGLVPEPPAQKTLEEITDHVYDAWVGTEINEWPDDIHGDLEIWLDELHTQLKGLAPAAPAHPEFLENEADYAAAPDGTIVATAENLPCHKFHDKWSSVDFIEMKDNKGMSRFSRRVLRFGWGNE